MIDDPWKLSVRHRTVNVKSGSRRCDESAAVHILDARPSYVDSTVAAAVSHVSPVDVIRRQFPALRREHRGHPVAYFDGPGGTQVPAVVVDRMRDYLLHHNANTHWAYPTSEETEEIVSHPVRSEEHTSELQSQSNLVC